MKLKAHGIDGEILQWTGNWLSDRKQRGAEWAANCHAGAMVVFHKLCRTAWPSRLHNKTESVSVMGHARSASREAP